MAPPRIGAALIWLSICLLTVPQPQEHRQYHRFLTADATIRWLGRQHRGFRAIEKVVSYFAGGARGPRMEGAIATNWLAFPQRALRRAGRRSAFVTASMQCVDDLPALWRGHVLEFRGGLRAVWRKIPDCAPRADHRGGAAAPRVDHSAG